MIAELIDPAILGFILVGVMLFAIFVGFPISFTLIFLGFVFGYLGFGKLVFYLMTLQFSMIMPCKRSTRPGDFGGANPREAARHFSPLVACVLPPRDRLQSSRPACLRGTRRLWAGPRRTRRA